MSVLALLSCSTSPPDAEDAMGMVMSEYNCSEEPVLENSYQSDDSYIFEYNVKWTTQDNFLDIYVPVSVYYYLDPNEHEWVYNYMEETGEETYNLNEKGLVGTWEGIGVVQRPTIDLTNLIDPNYEDKVVKVGVSLKINSVDGDNINYELYIDKPALEGCEWDYSNVGSYQLKLDASYDDYYVLWNDDENPLIVNTIETKNWSGRHVTTTDYGFISYTSKNNYDSEEETTICLKAYHGGEGKDITLTKVS